MGIVSKIADAIEGKDRTHKNVGRRVYSPFFRKDLLVTAYKNDREWWFRFHGGVKEHKAQTALSYFINKGYEKEE